MNRLVNINTVMSLLLVSAAAASGQGRRGPQSPAGAPSSAVNMIAVQVIQGTVTDLDVALGTRYPTVVVGGIQIKLAPAWYLIENDIEVKTGDTVKITAAPSADTADRYLYAIDLTKGTAFLELRDSQGFPLWTGGWGMDNRRGNGFGTGSRNGTGERQGCLDAGSIRTVTGTVERVSAGVAIQFPTVVLKTADNHLLTIQIGPERLLLAADFEITAGQALTVRYAASTCKDELVALELADSSGRQIVLRQSNGAPAWN